MNSLEQKKTRLLPGRRGESERECDFYLNPTLLSRLILHQRYPSAITRVKKHPLEASTWVSSTRKHTSAADASNNNLTDPSVVSDLGPDAPASVCTPDSPIEVQNEMPQQLDKTPRKTTSPATQSNKGGDEKEERHDQQVEDDSPSSCSSEPVEYSFRQLPLHMACSGLSRVYDIALRQKLNELIGQLVVTFPAATRYRDHQGRLPLHEAIWNNASPDSVTLMLISYPEAVDELDIYGRTVLELNDHGKSTHKHEIRRMLLRPRSFWSLARREKDLRLKHAVVWGAGASIASTSVLADSRAGDEENSVSTLESAFQGRAPIGYESASRTQKGEKVEATSWSQLEARALALEQSLAEQYEQQYNMAEELSRLREIEKKYNLIKSSDLLAQQVIQLEEDKAALEAKVNLMENLLKRNDLSVDDASVFTKPTTVVLDTSRDTSAVLLETSPVRSGRRGEARLHCLRQGARNDWTLDDQSSSHIPETVVYRKPREPDENLL